MANRETEAINDHQQKLVDQILDILRQFVQKLSKDNTSCTDDCNSMLLGALVKQIPHNWLWPEHPKPFSGISFDGIKQAIYQLRVPACQSTSLQAEQYDNSSKRYVKKHKLRRLDTLEERDDGYDCRPRNSLFPEIERLETLFSGLQLENWVDSRNPTLAAQNYDEGLAQRVI